MPAGAGGGASRGGGVASVGVRSGGLGAGAWRGRRRRSGVVAEERPGGGDSVPLAALGVEDPELRPAARRAVAAVGDERLGPLADDVAPEPDPRARLASSSRMPGRFGDRGRQTGRQAGRLEGDEERLGPAGESRQATQPVGDLGRGRAGVRSRRAGRSRGRRPSGRRGACRRSTGPRRGSRASGRRASRAGRRGRRPRPDRARGRGRARRRSRRRPGPRRRAAGRGWWPPELGAPFSVTLARGGSPPGPTIASSAGKPVRTTRSTPVRGSLAGEGAAPSSSSGGSAGSGAVASAPTTRGLPPPSASEGTPRAAETSGERLAIGLSDYRTSVLSSTPNASIPLPFLPTRPHRRWRTRYLNRCVRRLTPIRWRAVV